jgi:hypothetical protein
LSFKIRFYPFSPINQSTKSTLSTKETITTNNRKLFMETKRLVIVAVGGQGNLLASSVLGEAAMRSGIPLHMSEIHGMAQRGGVVESSLVFGDARSTIISDGEADVLVGFEPVNATPTP